MQVRIARPEQGARLIKTAQPSGFHKAVLVLRMKLVDSNSTITYVRPLVVRTGQAFLGPQPVMKTLHCFLSGLSMAHFPMMTVPSSN